MKLVLAFPKGATMAEMREVVKAVLWERERIRETRRMHKRERKAYERQSEQR